MVKFAIYSFLGYIIESAYISILNKKLYLSGLLKGPFIPLYGFGSLIILSIVPRHANILDIFFYSLISCTTLEYLTHYFLKTDLNIEIWNYSLIPNNFTNRICLFYSILWGVLGVLLVNYIDPFINNILININCDLFNVVSFIYFLIILYQFFHHDFNIKAHPNI